MDDMLVFSKTTEEHHSHSRSVLQRLVKVTSTHPPRNANSTGVLRNIWDMSVGFRRTYTQPTSGLVVHSFLCAVRRPNRCRNRTSMCGVVGPGSWCSCEHQPSIESNLSYNAWDA
jgi:hypothetical protein